MENIMLENSIITVTPSLCTGCAACYNVCPKNAIQMDYDDEGFWHPVIQNSLCINCGLCKNVCPAEDVLKMHKDRPNCFAVMAANDTLRKNSSSGEMFGLLADFVRQQGGYVCGAAFSTDLTLRHVIVSAQESLEPLMGSKYLQSHVGKTFKKIKELLDKNQWVLFCGTPCQVAGLNKFLNKGYDKLITADLMCHGGPSPKAFKKYVAEAFPHETVVDYRFREKGIHGWGNSETVYLKNKKEIRRIKGPSSFFRIFRSCISVRESCGTCKAASLPRQGDFTLADAWLIRQISPAFDDSHGTSIVSVNSDKAETIFNSLKDQMKLCEPIPLDWVLTHGQPMNRPFKATPFHHKRFFELLRSNSFERAASYTLQGKFDVAVVGVWYGCNYGSLLTYYSLYSYLKSLGLLVLMVDKSPLAKGDPELNPKFHSRKFCIRHYGDRMSRPRFPERMFELNKFADTFILGSDQVLHKNCLEFTKNSFLLNFVDDTKKKIAFSSSFGHETDSNPPEKRAEIGYLLRRFDHIGLREETGVQILRDNYGVNDATTVVDAIFLNDVAFYKKLSEESLLTEKEPFIVTYILDPNPEIKKALLHISSQLKCKLINLLDGATFRFAKNAEALGLDAVENLEVQDWLYYFCNARFVVTDSYHGTCFSVLLNKDFITFANPKRGLARFKTILTMTGLENRIVFDPKEVQYNKKLFEAIDYIPVNNVMASQIDKTKTWLHNALFSPKRIVNDAKWDLEVVNTIKNTNHEYDHYLTLDSGEDALVRHIEIYDYLDKLRLDISKYLILISVKDTPGLALNRRIAVKLNNIGVINNLANKHWHGFISVINGGKNIFESLADNKGVHYSGYIEGNYIDIDSKPFKQGNISRILINGKNFSLNRRGLNFVIFDITKDKVVDTVNFDTHDKLLRCNRVE